jgi:glycosyltransferase involved in cell wall biosynthesis
LIGTILDRPSFYRALDAFLLPSLYEGLPMAVLEAMASGVPILASRLEGISSVLEEQKEGLLALPGNLADFSEQLKRLKESPDLRACLSHAARAKALSQFAASATARRIETIYRRELSIANAKAAAKNSAR